MTGTKIRVISYAESRRLVRADNERGIYLLPEPPTEQRKRQVDSDGVPPLSGNVFSKTRVGGVSRQTEWYRGENKKIFVSFKRF